MPLSSTPMPSSSSISFCSFAAALGTRLPHLGHVGSEVAVAAGEAHEALELGREGVHVFLGQLDFGHELTDGGQEDNRLVQGKQPRCQVFLFNLRALGASQL